ncbi:DUF3857 domain-containing protein [Xanthobacteraceae bacterium A53D]
MPSISFHYDIAPDYTYVKTVTLDQTISSPEDIAALSEVTADFEPGTSSVRFVQAWVEQPDKTRVTPPPHSVLTRPTPAAQNAPGFVSSQSKVLILPQLKIGSRVFVQSEFTVQKPSDFGFNEILAAAQNKALDMRVSFNVPDGVPLRIAQRGGFQVTDTTDAGTRKVDARLHLDRPIVSALETYAPDPMETAPVFIITSIASVGQIGTAYLRGSAPQSVPTPEITALARQIVGDRTGREAARAIHDWVAGNIRYLAVWLGAGTTMVPHSAATVLKNGYGDCKDHVALMQALLSAVNIRSAPALINLNAVYSPLPLWLPDAFNHVMVYLPDFDTYANPTSPFAPFGVLERELAGKQVLIASDTPELRTTPPLTVETSFFRSGASVELRANGMVAGKVATTASPAMGAAMRAMYADPSKAGAQMSRAVQAMPEGGFGEIHTSQASDLDTDFSVNALWISPHAFAADARYMLLPVGPNLAPLQPLHSYLSLSDTRVLPVVLGVADLNWQLDIRLPPGHALHAVPPAVSIDNTAGSYNATYENRGGQLHVQRRLVFKQTLLPAAQYTDLKAVIYAALADARTIVALDGGP